MVGAAEAAVGTLPNTGRRSSARLPPARRGAVCAPSHGQTGRAPPVWRDANARTDWRTPMKTDDGVVNLTGHVGSRLTVQTTLVA